MLRTLKMIGLSLLLATALGLSGCGFGDVQLEGKVFEALGASNLTKKRKEAKFDRRSPLVMPPTTGALPQPGARQADPQKELTEQQLATINDADRNKVNEKERLAREQKEFCEKNSGTTIGVDDDAIGPLGSCRKSILGAISLDGLGL